MTIFLFDLGVWNLSSSILPGIHLLLLNWCERLICIRVTLSNDTALLGGVLLAAGSGERSADSSSVVLQSLPAIVVLGEQARISLGGRGWLEAESIANSVEVYLHIVSVELGSRLEMLSTWHWHDLMHRRRKSPSGSSSPLHLAEKPAFDLSMR